MTEPNRSNTLFTILNSIGLTSPQPEQFIKYLLDINVLIFIIFTLGQSRSPYTNNNEVKKSGLCM